MTWIIGYNYWTKCLKNGIIVLFILFVLSFAIFYRDEDENILTKKIIFHRVHNNKDLKLIHVIFRHGDKTPDDTYANDIYINHTYYPYGWGQLTNRGRLNQYQTGIFLRERYGNFLGDLYSTSKVYAQSTDVDRTYMSCAITMAGLWPTKGTALNWNFMLNWSPIPIRRIPLFDDNLLLPVMNCPRYYEELENVQENVLIKSILNDNLKLFNELTNLTGMSIQSPGDVLSLYSTLKAQVEYGLNLSKEIKQYYPKKLLPLSEIKYLIDGYNIELLKLRTGPLLKKLIAEWSDKSNNILTPTNRKMFVYCAHDWSIANILLALGAWNRQIPSYGIMIMFELYQDTVSKEHSVEVYLRNSTKNQPTLLTIKGCSPHCPLKDLIKLLQPYIPENWEEECKSKNPNYSPPPPFKY